MSHSGDKTLLDNKRNNLNLHRSEVKKLLPAYFQDDYPKLIRLLELYYEWLDKQDGFEDKIHRLNEKRDVTIVSESLLEFLEDELLLGNAYFGGFLNKREAIKFSNLLYRSKGTKYSIEQFFRGFFGVDPVIIYPKESIFKVGPEIDYELNATNTNGEQIKQPASTLGPESFKYITDDKLYQVLSILIRVNIPIDQWVDVYKLFAHPAGFYIGSEVLIEVVNENWDYDGDTNVGLFTPFSEEEGISYTMEFGPGEELTTFTASTSIATTQPDAYVSVTTIEEE
jgi:hypothetical protein